LLEKTLDYLIKNNLTIEQVFVLKLLTSNCDKLELYFNLNQFDVINVLQDLHVRNYINLVDNDIGYRFDNIIVNYLPDDDIEIPIVKDLKTELNSDYNTMWDEIISTYPKKNSTGRPLHNDRATAKKKYLHYLRRNMINHDDVIRAIKNEIIIRKKHLLRKEFIPEWKLLTTYVNQMGWEQYLAIENETNDVDIEHVF
jgi:hypothetical protein